MSGLAGGNQAGGLAPGLGMGKNSEDCVLGYFPCLKTESGARLSPDSETADGSSEAWSIIWFLCLAVATRSAEWWAGDSRHYLRAELEPHVVKDAAS